MIVVCGGIKGGVGKTTVATNLAVLRSLTGKDVLMVDADDQGTASDFSLLRAEERGGDSGYTCVKLSGAAVRADTLKMAPKYDDVVIDVGGRDTAGQRAAMSIANLYLSPFLPGSFDVWTLEPLAALIEEAKAFNENLKAYCFINRADPIGKNNEEAGEIASETPNMDFITIRLGNRKAFRNAAASGLTPAELRPKDPKAIAEMQTLYDFVFNSK